jgi:hypothetical protein
MKKLVFPLIVMLGIFLSACNLTVVSGSGKIVSNSRAVSGFTHLAFDAPGELTITQNGKESLRIEGDDNLLGYIQTEVIDGALHIYLVPDGTALRPTQPIRYTLSVKNLKQVSLNGSGKITAADLKSEQFALMLNGSGDIAFDNLNVATLDFSMNGAGSLNLQNLTAQKVTLGTNGSGDVTVNALSADELRADVNGSGEYMLKGKVSRQNVSILGSGKYDAHSLQSSQAEISVIGSGDSQVWATETISASILGSGDVGYVGKPKITQQIAGSGDIYPLK